jgi:hypothetical protein
MRKSIKNFNLLIIIPVLFFKINNFQLTSSSIFNKKIGKDFKLFMTVHKIRLTNVSKVVNMYHAKTSDIIMIFLNF